MTRCMMCGYEYEETQLTCHSACPLAPGCQVICCPRCGYSTVDPAKARLVRWVQRLARPRAAAAPARPAGEVPLLSLAPGQTGTVAAITPTHPERARQLSQYGLTTGTPIRLLQKRPVPIIQVGETDLVVDTPIAAEIYVAAG